MNLLVRLVAAAALLTLTGCSAAVAGTPTAAGDAGVEQTAAAVGGLRIPAIGVDVAQLVPLALDDQRQPEVPPEATPEVAGWYVLGPAPGDPGPAVILGHVGANGTPGVFYRLQELQAGDRITVDHNGQPVEFEVYERQQASKDEFPRDRVFGSTAGAELRLVTCGGALNSAEHSFEDNIIIYARKV